MYSNILQETLIFLLRIIFFLLATYVSTKISTITNESIYFSYIAMQIFKTFSSHIFLYGGELFFSVF